MVVCPSCGVHDEYEVIIEIFQYKALTALMSHGVFQAGSILRQFINSGDRVKESDKFLVEPNMTFRENGIQLQFFL